MLERLGLQRSQTLIVQFDGATGTTGRVSGLGVVIRNEQGQILQVLSKPARPQTNNEAEYEALIWALEWVVRHPPAQTRIYSDSDVVVNQMRGVFSVNSPALKKLHRRACELARRIPQISFHHIPREFNQLADALATEALWQRCPWKKNVA